MTTKSNGSGQVDLGAGVPVSDLPGGGMLAGRVGDEEVVLVRSGEEFFAVANHCTHYGGALSDGLLVGRTVRCPLHHACFDLRTGEALRTPAFDSLSSWRVERQGDRIFVREKLDPAPARPALSGPTLPESILIVGGGAAGLAAADAARRAGYDRPVTILSAEADPPIDRPNLSKDFLAGGMPDDWMPLRPPAYYDERGIELVLGARVVSIDAARRTVTLEDGKTRSFGALLLATGADPIRLPIPGADGSRVHYLRSFADGRALAEKAGSAGHVVIAGASFIGLEVAASLRARGIAVDVVAPESAPLERVMGKEIGAYARRVHEAHGVRFHLGESVARVDDRAVTLKSGRTLDADLVVMGVGVRPSIALAESAGLRMDRGVAVDEHLETSVPGIFAAGDIARWPDRGTGGRIRVEHWVVAERQGSTAARNMLGLREPFHDVPYFWSQHYDASIRYVGHAEGWDDVKIDGDPAGEGGFAASFFRGGRRLAVATLARDRASLEAEVAMEVS